MCQASLFPFFRTKIRLLFTSRYQETTIPDLNVCAVGKSFNMLLGCHTLYWLRCGVSNAVLSSFLMDSALFRKVVPRIIYQTKCFRREWSSFALKHTKIDKLLVDLVCPTDEWSIDNPLLVTFALHTPCAPHYLNDNSNEVQCSAKSAFLP